MKDTRVLVVDYVGFRLRSKFKQSCLRGLPREYLVPPSNPSAKATNLRTLAMNLEGQHDELFQQICLKVDLSEFQAEENFRNIATEIFSTGMNWGRVVSLITFAGAVAHHFVEQERPEMVCEVVQWLCDFIRAHLVCWIIENGGWDGFVGHFNGDKPPKSFWTGVLAMGAVGAVGAAGFTFLALTK